MKKNIKWIVFSISLLLFIIIVFMVVTHTDLYIDSFIYGLIDDHITNNLTSYIKYITYIGSAVAVIGIVVFVYIFFKNKKYSLYMTINLISITIFQLILKNIFSRNRPVDINLIEEEGYSFPSGHSLTALAFYGFIIYLIYKSKIKYKSLFISLFVLIILSVGFSRIYLGVHFFTDVIGAFTFALSYLILYTSIIEKRMV